MTDHGKWFEAEVADLCGELYLRDYVLASPKFRTQKNKMREAADALLPAGDTLIAFQVKTRQVSGVPILKSSPELGRISKKIIEATGQIKTVCRAFDSGTFESASTLRGVKVPIGRQNFQQIVGVVVFDVVTLEGESVASNIECIGGYAEVNGIPVHIFRAPDFREIAQEQDTPADLVNYLNCRGRLFAEHKLSPFVSELDLFGLFKTRYPDIEEVLRHDKGILIVEPNLWKTVHARFPDMWQARDERIGSSYIVDQVIEQVHTCISYDSQGKSSCACPEDFEPQDMQGAKEYWEIVQRLGRLTRVERAQFGNKIIEKLKAADKKPIAFTLIHRDPDVGPLVFLASNKARRERIMILQQLMEHAAAIRGTSHSTGIATQSFSAGERCYDFAVMEEIAFANPEAARREAAKCFGTAKVTSFDEWGRDYATNP